MKGRNVADADMSEFYNAIGQEIAAIIGKNPDGAYAYVEAEEMMLSPSLFHDVGNRVVYYSPSSELCEAIWDLWYAEPEEKRWATMHYEIADGQFSVEFGYEENADPEELSMDRRDRILKARYGDKPIYYPPPEDWPEVTEDDLSSE